jgi:tetratricopeptide (TPR) repeat protein
LRRWLAPCLALLCVWAARPAAAQPSVWEVAKDPRQARAHHALVAVERMLLRADIALDPFMQRNFMRGALAMLELAGGEELPDPRVRYLLADLLLDSTVQRDAEARSTVERALALAPDSPLAGRGWFNLAIACAKLGDPQREREAYTRALDLIWEPRFRSNILVNRGESHMVQGNLLLAIRDYREAIRIATGPDHQALGHYGLGIALERSGDLPAALDSMRVAESIQFPGVGSALDLAGVFFVPDYDKHYYRALGAMALARSADKPVERRAELERAFSEWQSYLLDAEPDGHRWAENARLHRASIEKQLAQLAKHKR